MYHTYLSKGERNEISVFLNEKQKYCIRMYTLNYMEWFRSILSRARVK